MLCPRCSGELKIGERKGIEIDYCVSCRGIWLDAGELDKIIERSEVYKRDRRNYNDRDYDRRDERDYDQRDYHGKKEESWWERIIDVFD